MNTSSRSNRQHADDLVAVAVDPHDLADGARVGAEMVLPVAVAQDNGPRGIRLVVL